MTWAWPALPDNQHPTLCMLTAQSLYAQTATPVCADTWLRYQAGAVKLLPEGPQSKTRQSASGVVVV